MNVIATVWRATIPSSDPDQNTGPTPASSSDRDKVCIPNISARERRKRLAGGVMAFVIALVVLAVLIVADTSRGWRLALFPLFAGATSGFFQWRDKT